MDKETKSLVIMAVAVLTVFGAAYAGIVMYSGTSSPFYTVESGSMMHSDNSKIGIVDTGDMVIIKSPSKAGIVTYAEGHRTGYQKFGSYGDVILYERPGSIAVIHRAIFYAGYNGDGTWDVSSLFGYGGDWDLNGIPGDTLAADDLKSVNGVLSFENFGHTGNKAFAVNLDNLSPKVSGYITMGDNNKEPDQTNGISAGAIDDGRIVGVAAIEVPWLGCIKLILLGNGSERIPGNSVIMLVMSFLLLIASIFVLNFVYERYIKKREE